MGMFNDLLSKIFRHASAAPSVTPGPSNTTIESATAPSATTPAASAVAPATAAPATTPNVAAPATTPAVSAPATTADAGAVTVQTIDVTTFLDGLAAKNSEKLDWKKSIVDLLKLVDMDSSLSARKQLANELHYPGDENDSATMNVWLHKQVLRQLSEHGGKIPRELL
jgi:3-oxoacyl-ACP reductase-like protein